MRRNSVGRSCALRCIYKSSFMSVTAEIVRTRSASNSSIQVSKLTDLLFSIRLYLAPRATPGLLKCLAYVSAPVFQSVILLRCVGFHAPIPDSNDSQPSPGHLAEFGHRPFSEVPCLCVGACLPIR